MPDQWNFLFVTLYFGLRPNEADKLKKEHEEKFWRIELQGNYEVLCIFQSKLSGLRREDRWKKIPCILEEQKKALEIIKSGEPIKRPLVKTIQRYFGENYNTYCGRKGFEFLLRTHGARFESISAYLGHRDLNRSWKSYTDKNEAYIDQNLVDSTNVLKIKKTA